MDKVCDNLYIGSSQDAMHRKEQLKELIEEVSGEMRGLLNGQ